ncbi:MAG TPA: ABC transporter permease [Pseudonocardiaceae bacterium]
MRTNGSFVGTGALTRFALRRDRIMLAAWIYLIVITVLGTLYSYKSVYSTPQELATFTNAIKDNASILAITGPSFGEYTVPAATAWKLGTWVGGFTGVLSLLLVIRHTRAEEETGRLELIDSTVVGRYAAPTAALLVAVIANVLIGGINAIGLIALGAPAAGSVAMGVGMCLTGCVFAAVAAVTAQITTSATGARGLALTVLGAAFLVRAVGDGGGPRGLSWLSWLSPLAWGPRMRPFTVERWWVLAIPLIVMLVVGAVGYALVPRRDFGDGLLPDRPGPATAARSFSNPFALAWRLQRGVLLTWVISYALFGAVLGSIVKMFVDVVRDNPEVSTIMARMGGQGAYTDLMVSAMMSLFGLVASAYAVQATQRLRTEESSRRVEPLLATGTSRIGWALSHVLFTVLGTAALMVAFGLCFGLVDGAREGTLGHTVGADLMAALVQLPAAWVLGALAVTLFGLWPRLTGLGWAAVAIAVVLTDLGTELRLPQLVMDISPYTHLPKLPGGTVTSTPLLWLLAVTVLLLVVGLIGFRRRDIDTP